MANIIKGLTTKKLTSMQDLKEEELVKQKEGKGRGKDKKLGKTNRSVLPVDLKFYEKFDPKKIQKKQLAYNEEIFDTIPEMYLPPNLKMTNKFLIRYFSRINKVETNTGILLPEAKLPGDVLYQKRRADGSGQNYPDSSKEVTNPFKFAEKAVIVNVPDWAESKYKVGDIISVHTPPTDCPIPGLPDVYYSDWFVHPDSGELKPPTNLQNPHYGYRMINEQEIRCIISNDGFALELEETKNNEK